MCSCWKINLQCWIWQHVSYTNIKRGKRKSMIPAKRTKVGIHDKFSWLLGKGLALSVAFLFFFCLSALFRCVQSLNIWPLKEESFQFTLIFIVHAICKEFSIFFFILTLPCFLPPIVVHSFAFLNTPSFHYFFFSYYLSLFCFSFHELFFPLYFIHF